MKWGHRSAESQARVDRLKSGASRKVKVVRKTTASKTAQALQNKKARSVVKKATQAQVRNRSLLTDEQLNTLIDRQKKETQLVNLTRQNVSPGKAFLSDTIKSIAKTAVKGVAAAVTLAAIQTLSTYLTTKAAQNRYKQIDQMRKDNKSDKDIAVELKIPEREVQRIMNDPYPEFSLTDQVNLTQLLPTTYQVMKKSFTKK